MPGIHRFGPSFTLGRLLPTTAVSSMQRLRCDCQTTVTALPAKILSSVGGGTPVWIDASGVGTPTTSREDLARLLLLILQLISYWEQLPRRVWYLQKCRWRHTDKLQSQQTRVISRPHHRRRYLCDLCRFSYARRFDSQNILIDSGSGLITLADSIAVKAVSTWPTAITFKISGTTILDATTLGSSVVGSSLTSVGNLASGSIANGFGSINTNIIQVIHLASQHQL